MALRKSSVEIELTGEFAPGVKVAAISILADGQERGRLAPSCAARWRMSVQNRPREDLLRPPAAVTTIHTWGDCPHAEALQQWIGHGQGRPYTVIASTSRMRAYGYETQIVYMVGEGRLDCRGR